MLEMTTELTHIQHHLWNLIAWFYWSERENVCYVIRSKIQCQTVLNALVERSAAIPASLVVYRRRLWRQRGISSAASLGHQRGVYGAYRRQRHWRLRRRLFFMWAFRVCASIVRGATTLGASRGLSINDFLLTQGARKRRRKWKGTRV